MTEIQMIAKLLAQYNAGMMLREEFWDQMMIIFTQHTPQASPVQQHRRRVGWRSR